MMQHHDSGDPIRWDLLRPVCFQYGLAVPCNQTLPLQLALLEEHGGSSEHDTVTLLAHAALSWVARFRSLGGVPDRELQIPIQP